MVTHIKFFPKTFTKILIFKKKADKLRPARHNAYTGFRQLVFLHIYGPNYGYYIFIQYEQSDN